MSSGLFTLPEPFSFINTLLRCRDLKPDLRKSRFTKGDDVLTNTVPTSHHE